MYYVITIGYNQRLVVPMNDNTSKSVSALFGNFESKYLEEFYVQGHGSAFEYVPSLINIEVWTKEKVDDYINRGLEHPRKSQ